MNYNPTQHLELDLSRVAIGSAIVILKQWPRRSRKTAQAIIDKYGPPHEATQTMLIWHYNGPWKRTIVYRDWVPHNFPRPHIDMLGQTVEYKVPAEKVGEIAKFDGSVIIDRTRGDMTVHCNNERMNIILLNLAHDIVIGAKTSEEARQVIIDTTVGMRFGWPEPSMEDLHFSTLYSDIDRETYTQDPDVSRVRI